MQPSSSDKAHLFSSVASYSRRSFIKVAVLSPFIPAVAGAAGVQKSQSGYDLTPMTEEEVLAAVAGYSDLSKKVLLKAGTERAFTGTTVNGYPHDTKQKGLWVSAASGVPVFSSEQKYNSGTGWPSFYAPYDPEHIIERPDPKDIENNLPKFLQRTEVLDRKSGTHLGHVFADGPKPTGLRYCMNAAALKFVPSTEEK
eukprot:CAMPEP_0117741822 /NCGR_PEP_ID=MMETSP0947-20121206/5154_1 /TAXON_ID=44440 /ORGANISM="Chattonella subsalsa, Strain CCMP2191" /LENGTH=197 /DNA_ID=CAMNT_0005558177 /DNA_START=227 /DNA_END=820 /DNA_ORIENTATION=-